MRSRPMLLTSLGLGLALSGCQVAGGGWIPSKYDGAEKATFGFSAACAPQLIDGGVFTLVDGEFQYKDHTPATNGSGLPEGTIVQLHGIVEQAIAIPLPDAGGDAAGLALDAGDEGGFDFCGLETDDGGFPPIVIDAGGEEGAWTGFFAGTYEPQPKKVRGVPRAGGTFVAHWLDAGEPPGLSDDDTIEIFLYGGEFGGYSNSGALGGGNIDFEFIEDVAPAN